MVKKKGLFEISQFYGGIGVKALVGGAIAWLPAAFIGGIFGFTTSLLINAMGGVGWESAMLVPMAVFFVVMTIVQGFVLNKIWGWA